MALEKVLYTAHATSTGGREGVSRSSDGALDVRLSTPKELGGGGGPGTNPEQLFAAGYSACFIGALKVAAGKQKVDSSIRSLPLTMPIWMVSVARFTSRGPPLSPEHPAVLSRGAFIAHSWRRA